MQYKVLLIFVSIAILYSCAPKAFQQSDYKMHLINNSTLEKNIDVDTEDITRDVILIREDELGFTPRILKKEWPLIEEWLSKNNSISPEKLLEIDKVQKASFQPAITGVLPQLAIGLYSEDKSLLDTHLSEVQKDVLQIIPETWEGYAVIDYEAWALGWYTMGSTGHYKHYQEVSKALVRNLFPGFSEPEVERKAKEDYLQASNTFFSETIKLCKKLRPKAKWGYYGYPTRFSPWRYKEHIKDIQNMNDNELSWLWKESDALFPSIYSYNQDDHIDYIAENIKESVRISKVFGNNIPVLPFTWYRYHPDSKNSTGLQFLSKEHLGQIFNIPAEYGASGLIMYGEDKNENTIKTEVRPFMKRALDEYKEVRRRVNKQGK
ncbi:MAG: hypothetical protein H6609_21060 [Ignavibacteriales bacterium]|nr:hypothetical protein [Ignavibacteriales bacterium]